MTLSKPLAAAFCAATIVLAVPVGAQDVPIEGESSAAEELLRADNDDTIVVTGDNLPITIRQVQRQARDIVVRTGNVFEEPLARFEDRLCPGIIGLDEEYAAMMIDRIRANARELDVRVQDDGCRANFVVAFVDDGDALLRRLMEESPHYFQYLNSGQKRDLLEPGPAHIWTNVEPRTLTGMPIAQVRNLINPPTMSVSGAHTRIYTTTRRDISSVMVTFDREAVVGLNLGQLADYATMRGLAQTRPSGDLAIDSILSLFELSRDDPNWAPPQRLTDFDRAYLRSLYAEIPNLPAARKLSGVGREMRRLAEGEGKADE